MKQNSHKTRDLEKEREDILRLAEARMLPELKQALVQAQALPQTENPTEIKTTFTEGTYAHTE